MAPHHRHGRVASVVSLLLMSAACLGTLVARQQKDAAARRQIVFFPFPAAHSREGKTWSLTVQGRVFEPIEPGALQKELVKAIAKEANHPGQEKESDLLLLQRVGYFLSRSDHVAGVSIRIGGKSFPLPPHDKSGYFTTLISLAESDAARLAKNGVISFQPAGTFANETTSTGQAPLVPDDGISVVTDMDDTIKNTNVRDTPKMFENTFLREFAAVRGMPELYQSWKNAFGNCMQFHVVSAGPWQLYEPLSRFTHDEMFPSFTWQMRSVVIDAVNLHKELTANPGDFKVPQIIRLMTLFPKRHFVFVGDSGEQDPEVYSTILLKQQFADRVDAVFIRDIGPGKTIHDYGKRFPGAAATKLHRFQDPKQLPALGTLVRACAKG